MDPKELIARRVARELRDNTLVNLGIGLPTLVAAFVPPGLQVYFQSENGIIGFGARPPEGMEDVHLTDAGGAFVSALPGSVAFDSAMSFALICGGRSYTRWPPRHDRARRPRGGSTWTVGQLDGAWPLGAGDGRRHGSCQFTRVSLCSRP